MKQIFTKLIVCSLLLMFAISVQAQRSNCGVAPYKNVNTQPDGSTITLTAFGNEAVHYLETEDGYTVLKANNGYFEYAHMDAQGNLAPSGIPAKDGILPKTNFAKHLRYSETQVAMLNQLFNQLIPEQELGKAGEPLPFPPKGVRKVIVLLVEYPDLPATISKENFELLLNQPGYNGTGSFKDYYYTTSKGQLELNSTVYGWIMADSGYKYYGRNSSPAYSAATRSLLLGAVKKANDSLGVDFSEYDNDKDGFVDGVIIMHAGIGAEEASAPNSGDYIWSFRSTLSSAQRPTYDGVKVAAYAMFPEKRWNGGNMTMVGIGVLCHEFAHLLDLPDLYATSYNNEGSGNFTLMAGGTWLNGEKTPCYNDAWSRIALGWIQPTVITEAKLYGLPFSVADSDMVYRINTSRPNEYYLLENRQRKDFDMYLPSRGLAIWHINTNFAMLLSKATSGNRNNVNNDTSQLGVGLIQADGLRHLERNTNRGDAGDFYPVPANRNFTPTTNPASRLHFKVNGVKQLSNVAITDITQNADSSITFEFGKATSAAFNPNRTSGCAPLTVGFSNNAVGGNKFFWNFGDGKTSTATSPSNVFTAPGTYEVKLIVLQDSIPVDSNTVSIRVLETPVLSYGWERADTSLDLKFINTTQFGKTYTWLFGLPDTTIRSNDINPNITLKQPGKIRVSISSTSNDGCVASRIDSIEIFSVGLITTLIDEPIFNVYPNPSQQGFYVDIPHIKNNATVEVRDVTGRLIYTITTREQTIMLPEHLFQNGVYMIQVSNGNSVQTKKVVRMN